jgi:hypothetical protein
MTGSADILKDTGSFVENIEAQMDGYLKAQKDQIEQGMMERIQREKEEARRKIEETEKEFQKEKAVVNEYKTVLAELRTEKEKLVGLIHEHFDRTQNCQKQIKIMTDQANEELGKIAELSEEIENVRSRVLAENERLKKDLRERFGITVDIPASIDIGDVPPDWSQEARRIEKIRDLLSSIEVSRPFEPSENTSDNGQNGEGRSETVAPGPVPLEPANLEPVEPGPVNLEPVEVERVDNEPVQPEPVRPEPLSAAAPSPEPPPAENAGFGAERQDFTRDDFSQEVEAVEIAPGTDPQEAAEAEGGEEFGNLLSGLVPYKKTEPVQGDRTFGYFQNAELKVLDGEMFIRTMTQIVNTAKELHSQLGEKESIKDLFMLKQEILNEQEILRKLFLRAVVFCEKEDGSLPYYISEVINTRSIKDVLERLTIGNWSDPAEFDIFVKDTNRLRDAFLGRVTNLEVYMKSVLGQLELND